MQIPVSPQPLPLPHSQRLRTTVKRLVIELGYLEYNLADRWSDPHLRAAAAHLDRAIAPLLPLPRERSSG